MTALSTAKSEPQRQLQLPRKFILADNGMMPVGKPTYDEWVACGDFIQQAHGALQWWRGDWSNYGEQTYGEAYAQEIEKFGIDYSTVNNERWVAKRFEFTRRRVNLSWSHHREVASLDECAQDELLDRAVSEELTQKELRQLVRRIKAPTPEVPRGKYRVLLADPPWEYTMGEQHTHEAQETVLSSHYESMSLPELCALKVPSIAADDAVLFLWATSPTLKEALMLAEAWGFEYKASFIWDKVKHNVGYYNSVRHELLLICTRGSCLPDSPVKLVDSVQSIEREEHSKKPEAFRQIIDRLYPTGPRIELFARRAAEGWESWGNEV